MKAPIATSPPGTPVPAGAVEPSTAEPAFQAERFIGIDLGSETIKVVELVRDSGGLRWTRRAHVDHHKEPGARLLELLSDWDWQGVAGAAASGRIGRQVQLPRVPAKQAQLNGARFLLGSEPVTLVSIGSHGFSILELRANGLEVFRENSRCSQGTGNFLRQLIERFSLSIEEASRLCAEVEHPAVLSGRCPVILKTDMTHLANKGEDRAAILAGLFDAVCENVLVLIKPELCPRRVALIGGVARSPRVQATFRRRLATLEMALLPLAADDGLYFEALGSAIMAAAQPVPVPPLAELLHPPEAVKLERLPALSEWRARVHRMPARPLIHVNGDTPAVILGFDIGSTGSKAVALEIASGGLVWEAYRATAGDPVGAAQALLHGFTTSSAAGCRVRGFGVTGSGREIVGSLLTACYGKESVYILNEIAAHAEGAHFYDERVDTIFEIGGQDAKYIRLSGGRVIDCAMNEACSAGTGSFIEEQGRKFPNIRDVVHLAEEAMAAREGVSLGQHCSVFMAEVIDEAVSAGIDRSAVIAGLYDSIIQNYLNRVKGSRSVGQVIFCQGMPFASDALAAAVARQTGAEVIVPPNPGTVGALGIALLSRRELGEGATAPMDARRFLEARVEGKDTFQCKATVGCGGAGNHCRIERLRTVVAGKSLGFTWGGGCALHDKGTRKRKLPDRAPDPFREREQLVTELLARVAAPRGRRRVAMTDEFTLKGLLPFFATFLHGLGLDPVVLRGGDHGDLKRGIRGANVAFCAPMQLYHGMAARMAEAGTEFVFLPMLRSVPTVNGEHHAVTCPIVQASPDIVRWDVAGFGKTQIISPVIDLSGGLEAPAFLANCEGLAASFGFHRPDWRRAHAAAAAVQREFDQECAGLGARALEFCATHDITPVIVMGRPYTIYNNVLNSNVPAILREQGAIGIPLDCYPVAAATPSYGAMYWGYGQRILRATHQVRRTHGQYSLYCSNYACGPDSFNLHFFAHAMAGKPYAIIETDGHSGDAGTKTRVEAFLHCVAQDRQRSEPAGLSHDFSGARPGNVGLRELLGHGERMLMPWMSDLSEAMAACMRGCGIAAECLSEPDRDALRRGQRETSGKECLPMVLTLGSLLQRLERAAPNERFVYLLPCSNGPCRFGVYSLLNQIVFQRLGWQDRIRLWSPSDAGYFDEFPPSLGILAFAGMLAADLLNEAALAAGTDGAPPGAADAIYQRARGELVTLLERHAAADLSTAAALWQVTGGRLFGLRDLLADASAQLAAIRDGAERPTVLLVGEIYVRCVPFANGHLINRLGQRGLRVRLVPIQEWLEYTDHVAGLTRGWWRVGAHLSARVQARIRHAASAVVDAAFGWPARFPASGILGAAQPYLRPALWGEAALTLGNPLLAWRHGQIDGVVSAGPHECMPNKIAESQFYHLAERESLPSLTLALNGDPLDNEVLDNFAFEVHSRFRRRNPGCPQIAVHPRQVRESAWRSLSP